MDRVTDVGLFWVANVTDQVFKCVKFEIVPRF